ncbi:MAG: hypothetical protein ACJAUA_000372 [Zhongshania aliphaticivorans]
MPNLKRFKVQVAPFRPFSQYDAGAHRDGAASGLELVETALPKSVQTFQELVLVRLLERLLKLRATKKSSIESICKTSKRYNVLVGNDHPRTRAAIEK